MEWSLASICAHAGIIADHLTGPVTAPIHFSTTYKYQPTGAYPTGYVYSRENNPTRYELEQVLSKLERGAAAAAFSSGIAAAHATFMSLHPGDHVIVSYDVYAGVRQLLKTIFMPWGLEVSFIDLSDLKNLEKAIKSNTALVWAESPTNPQLKIIDLTSLIQICKGRNILVAVDNTFATPVLQNPLVLGADLVMHSTTKYLAGHSDLTGGALITARPDAWWDKIRNVQYLAGAVPSPFDCWLLLRGIRSLVSRMQTHISNAKAVATFLEHHPKVKQVIYPGLPSHPGFNIAQKQMREPGAMLSVLVKHTATDALNIAGRLKVFTNATSLGGTESLVEHRYSAEGPDSPTPPNLLRFSIGLESAEDLIADLQQAFLDA